MDAGWLVGWVAGGLGWLVAGWLANWVWSIDFDSKMSILLGKIYMGKARSP